ncbi:MAG TPA: hypothetical protein VFY68_00320 [Nitrososphaeraceae archaeon]|nr:hypothetical protein [Nitrososphaeraceae archaeon]
MSYNYLTPEQENVIVHKSTEAPYSGSKITRLLRKYGNDVKE